VTRQTSKGKFGVAGGVPKLRERRGRALLAALTALAVAAIVGIVIHYSGGGTSGGSSARVLPDGFPAAVAVAVVSGPVADSVKIGSEWSLTIKVADAKAQDAALQLLKAKGYVVVGENAGTTPATRVYSLANSQYSVRLAYATVGGSPAVTYAVAARQSG
jgi:hypothetical protein